MILGNSKNRLRLPAFLLGVLAFCAIVFTFHVYLQDENHYYPFRHIIKNYEVSLDSNWVKSAYQTEKPFAKIRPQNLIVWDAAHYNDIRVDMYQGKIAYNEKFAFFPLFPLMWKALGVNAFGICLVNWLLFFLGMLVMFQIFKEKDLPYWAYFMVLLVPMTVVYMIPYSEALFFLCIAFGMYGILKEKYWFYFIGFLLASMARSSANIFLVAFLCVEMLVSLRQESFKHFITHFLKRILPIILGVFLVMLFQKLRGAESWFAFIKAQSYWDKKISLPSLPFTDWSSEGKSITFPFILMYFVPMLIVLARECFLRLLGKKKENISTWDYLRYLSILYIVGNIILAMLTQQGGLYSLSRYMLCTPFFVFLLYDTVLRSRNNKWQIVYGLIGLLSILYFLKYFSNFQYCGIWLIMLGSLLAFYHRRLPNIVVYILLIAGILFNVVWTAYLYNNFLVDAWIYT